jgi:site-specific DNA-methyltransferase (adenine-specific)
MIETNYNPDVLSCLANLSNDEVFTPPSLVNEILDLLPNEIWENKDLTFLDPVSKSGVFLREIAKRLIVGLEKQIPDKQERINHILTKQLYGIAITELTSLLSRRSVYCSKLANGKYSICDEFKTAEGNIAYERLEHTWENKKCKFCGASQEVYDREDSLETYAYPFIHIDITKKIFKNMKFDVIVGNPPYQMSDGGSGNGISAKPLYHEFVKQAKKLNPNYLTMIIPSRWFAGGKGLDEFRDEMLKDKRIKKIVDYPKSRDCFPGVDIAGGVCYFIWDKKYKGDCELVSMSNDIQNSKLRNLSEFDILIRDNIGIDIIRKIKTVSKKFMSESVYSRNPFGFVSSERGASKSFPNSISLISSSGIGYVKKSDIQKNTELISHYKVIIGKVNPDRGGVNNASDGKVNVITKVKILNPNEIMTETYLLLASFEDEKFAKNCANFYRTKFTRFLISLTLSSMNITRENFQFVPNLNLNENWTDEKLYSMYDLNQDEIEYIENSIRTMEIS